MKASSIYATKAQVDKVNKAMKAFHFKIQNWLWRNLRCYPLVCIATIRRETHKIAPVSFVVWLCDVALLFRIWDDSTVQHRQQFVFDFHDFLNYCSEVRGHVSHAAHQADVSAKSTEKSQNLMLSESFPEFWPHRLCFRAFQGKLGWGCSSYPHQFHWTLWFWLRFELIYYTTQGLLFIETVPSTKLFNICNYFSVCHHHLEECLEKLKTREGRKL